MRHSVVDYGSEKYRACVELRERVLRKPLGVEFTPEELALEPSSWHLAIFHGSELLACLVMTPRDERSIQMRQVVVEAQHQRQGVGRAIVSYAEAEAGRHGYREVFAHARAPAATFYRKLGYSVGDNGFIEVGVLHYLVSKRLSLRSSLDD